MQQPRIPHCRDGARDGAFGASAPGSHDERGCRAGRHARIARAGAAAAADGHATGANVTARGPGVRVSGRTAARWRASVKSVRILLYVSGASDRDRPLYCYTCLAFAARPVSQVSQCYLIYLLDVFNLK